MKIIFENINDKNYFIKFHETFMYVDNDSLQYLFNLSTPGFSKKYLCDFKLDDFKNFVKLCIELGENKLDRFDFESRIIQLVEKYNEYPDVGTRLLLDKKIGNLLLFNHKFTDFSYLKKLEKHFYTVPKTNYIMGFSGLIQNKEIKYLLILINNLMDVKIDELYNNQMFNTCDNFRLLDFIFDYYD
jgi:hypothetical protein